MPPETAGSGQQDRITTTAASVSPRLPYPNCSRGGFLTRDLPVTADALCLCGHPRSVHNMLWNACRDCPPKGER